MILRKGDNIQLCKGLSLKEFQCRCHYDHCKAVLINSELVRCYERFRRSIGKPLRVNSGHRCHLHNHEIGGTELSRHIFGQAIDISRHGIMHISDESITEAAKRSGFKFVKLYSEFFHLDIDERD